MFVRAVPACLLLLALLACAGCDGGSKGQSNALGATAGTPTFSSVPIYADRVVTDGHLNVLDAAADVWPYFFQAAMALGAPRGTFDVLSLGYDPTQPDTLGGFLVVGLGDAAGHRCAVDGPGADLVVYENPFPTTDADGNTGTANEVATVEVSMDGSTWYLFPPSENLSLPLIAPARYHNLAGVTPTGQGGDSFDLNDISGLPAGFMACYVRITDGGTRYADYGNTQTDLWDSGADIDAVEALHSVPAPASLAR